MSLEYIKTSLKQGGFFVPITLCMKKKGIVLLLVLLFSNIGLLAQTSISGVVNSYNTLVSRKAGNCGDTIIVASLPTYNVGELLMFYNPGGATFDTTYSSSFGDSISLNHSGKYAFAYVSQVSATLLMVLDRSIGNAFGNGSMVIRVPEYNYADVANTLTAPAYQNGQGGILVLSANKLRLSADIDLSEKGFAGGIDGRNMGYSCGSSAYRYPTANNGGGPKGEGIGLIPSQMANGRGHALNGGGGGNNHNAGGGGGANGGAGGKGGNEWSGCSPVSGIGGLGGEPLISNAISRLYFGGGGGSGHNNVSGLTSEGGNGGGILLLLVDTLIANGGEVISNGGDGKLISNGAEGAGGGGAGGTIVFTGPNLIGAVDISAVGGVGGNCTGGSAGPGGGGGGGVIWIPSPSLGIGSALVNGGNSGTLSNGTNKYGSIDGNSGFVRAVSNLNRPQPFSGGGNQTNNFLGNDTLICALDSILLSAPNGSSYLWSTGDTTQSIYAQGAGSYWVQVTIGACSYSDTLLITNYPGGSGSFLGPDQSICLGSALTISTSVTGSYFWSTGATTNSITINRGGWYWLDIKVGTACPSRDSIFINEDDFNTSAIAVDTTFCANEGYQHTYPSNWTATWPDGSSANSYTFSTSGIFFAAVYNQNGCERIDTFKIRTLGTDSVVPLFSVSDTSSCLDSGFPVDFSYLKGEVFWNDGQTLKVRTLYASRRWIVRYEEDCLSSADTLNLSLIDCDTCSFFIPNAFSPNGDALNDILKPISSCDFEELNLRIFDRWGELLYESRDLNASWDGSFRGRTCMQGIYLYDILYKLPFQEVKRQKGTVLLKH